MKKSPELLDDALAREKRPNLRVISPETVAEVAAVKPTVLFSAKVLQHVHPDESAEYFANILAMIGSWGRAFIACQWNNVETLQYRTSSWAHPLRLIDKPWGASAAS